MGRLCRRTRLVYVQVALTQILFADPIPTAPSSVRVQAVQISAGASIHIAAIFRATYSSLHSCSNAPDARRCGSSAIRTRRASSS